MARYDAEARAVLLRPEEQIEIRELAILVGHPADAIATGEIRSADGVYRATQDMVELIMHRAELFEPPVVATVLDELGAEIAENVKTSVRQAQLDTTGRFTSVRTAADQILAHTPVSS